MEVKLVKPKQILCKVTSRSRPSELLYCIENHLNLASDPTALTWLFTFDTNDDKYNSVAFCDSIAHIINGDVHFVFGDSVSKIDAINRDVNEFEGHWDILLNVSDDQIPIIKGWDSIIRDSMPNNLDASLWFSDGWQHRINTQEVIGRTYYQRDKYIYHPGFKSFFCDNLSTMVAQKRGCLLKKDQCIIKHFHPGWSKESHMKLDEVYNKCTKDWSHDEGLFNQLKDNI